MPGKGLGSLLALLLAAALLGGCGGGDSSGEASAPGSSSVESEVAERPAPKSEAEAAEQLRQDAGRVKREREEAQRSPSDSQQAKPAAEPPAEPKSTHHDSGGGAAQFVHGEGDNSIQEFGSEASAPEREAAAAVLHAYLDARVARHWDEACFYMASALVVSIERFAARYGESKGIASCSEVLVKLSQGESRQAFLATAEADVGSLRIDGDHGFLLYHGPGDEPYAMSMLIEAGVWKVGSLEGSPLL